MPKHYPSGRPELDYVTLVAKAEKYVRGGWAKETLPDGNRMVYPMAQALAKHLAISRETLYAREEFSDIVRELKEMQELVLVNNGLQGLFNPVTTKLALSSKHGYVEQTKVDSENLNKNLNQDVSDLDDEQIKSRLASLRQS